MNITPDEELLVLRAIASWQMDYRLNRRAYPGFAGGWGVHRYQARITVFARRIKSARAARLASRKKLLGKMAVSVATAAYTLEQKGNQP